MAASAHPGAAHFFPVQERKGLNYAAAFLPDRFQSGPQGNAGYSAPAMLLVDDKTTDAPEGHSSGCIDRRLLAARFGRPMRVSDRSGSRIVTAMVETRKLFSETVLAPSHGLATAVDQDSVRAASVDELFFVPPIPCPSFGPGGQPLISRQCASPLKVYAPAEIPAVTLAEQFLKVRPCLGRKFLRAVCRS
jgi:hypothetical protein